MDNPWHRRIGGLALLLLAAFASYGQATKKSVFEHPDNEYGNSIYKIFGISRAIPIKQGYIVTKMADTLWGYIDMNKFDISEKLRQVAILPFGKQNRSDIRIVQLDSIDYISTKPQQLADSGRQEYMPVDGAMWRLVGRSACVRICGRYGILNSDNSYDLIVNEAMVMFSCNHRIEIPVAGYLSLHSDLYFFAKFVRQRYGTNIAPRDLKHKDPIQVILARSEEH